MDNEQLENTQINLDSQNINQPESLDRLFAIAYESIIWTNDYFISKEEFLDSIKDKFIIIKR